MKEQFYTYIQNLQDQICEGLEVSDYSLELKTKFSFLYL